MQIAYIGDRSLGEIIAEESAQPPYHVTLPTNHGELVFRVNHTGRNDVLGRTVQSSSLWREGAQVTVNLNSRRIRVD